ncbi:DUF4340 domain-containing protein [Parahaliea maris]|uniref:DUF4340 domain-containing protein n=1 Tax=Parahaliea maris TaxID=2716870 RepID=UPI00164F771F|nr:DUF4340 domain-containing protein [Parahaliea maris]
MNRTILALLFLLAVQVLLAGVLAWSGKNELDERQQLLPAGRELQVDEIRIADAADSEVVLRQVHGQWLLPELQNLPASQQRVTRLLETLARQPHGFPVANSAAARQRYRVTSYQFHRRLGFYHGQELLETVYLGRSPAYRQVYARNSRSNDIYSLRYSNHDAPATANAWLDRNLLQVAAPSRMEIAGLRLERSNDQQWRTRDGHRADGKAVERLLKLLRELKVTGLADEDMQRSLAEDGAAQRIIRLRQGGQDRVLELLVLEGQFYAKDARYPLFFIVDPRQYLALLQFDRQRLTGASAAQVAPSKSIEETGN